MVKWRLMHVGLNIFFCKRNPAGGGPKRGMAIESESTIGLIIDGFDWLRRVLSGFRLIE